MPHRSGQLRAELVGDPGELSELAPAWRSLAVSRSNGFTTPEWFWAWQRHYGSEQAPMVAVVRHAGGELRGLLPLVIARRRPRGARFAGSSVGDHFELLAAADDEPQIAGLVGSLLRDHARSWRFLVLENVDQQRDWWTELSRASGCGLPLVGRVAILPSARLTGLTWDDYLASRSRNLRSQLRRKLKALERDHVVSVRWTVRKETVAADMATLFRLHDERWASRPSRSSLTSPRARAFHTDFATAASEWGWLRLGFLEVDSAPVAGWYGWRVGDRFAYYQAGFDPEWGDHSVGLLLFAATIRAAIEEGAAQYDMLLGDEAYKQRFADSARHVCTAMVAPRWRGVRAVATLEARSRALASRLPEPVRGALAGRARALLERLPMGRRR